MLADAGMHHFDVASADEVARVAAAAPQARAWFMHPVKSRLAIAHAWQANTRDFALDSLSELMKVLEVVGPSADLGLHVRLAVNSTGAAWDLSGKFGAPPNEAAELLRAARSACDRLGICFHVGSQCMTPAAYHDAIRLAGQVARASGVRIDSLDVGGGFPAPYPHLTPPPLEDYFDAIHFAAKEYGFGGVQLICEPGRALVADSGSLCVRVELRRDSTLYVNDGTYGALFDAGVPRWRYPARLVRLNGRPPSAETRPFSLFGPTCDSLDRMEGPFMLPADVSEGDWIELGQLGAYGVAMKTQFNGFGETATAFILADHTETDHDLPSF